MEIKFVCDHCHKTKENQQAISIASGDCVCKSCLEKHYTRCTQCEEYYLDDELSFSETLGDIACNDCKQRELEGRMD